MTSVKKSDVTIVFPDPDFGNSCTFKADFAFFIFAWDFRTSGSKNGGFRRK